MTHLRTPAAPRLIRIVGIALALLAGSPVNRSAEAQRTFASNVGFSYPVTMTGSASTNPGRWSHISHAMAGCSESRKRSSTNGALIGLAVGLLPSVAAIATWNGQYLPVTLLGPALVGGTVGYVRASGRPPCRVDGGARPA